MAWCMPCQKIYGKPFSQRLRYGRCGTTLHPSLVTSGFAGSFLERKQRHEVFVSQRHSRSSRVVCVARVAGRGAGIAKNAFVMNLKTLKFKTEHVEPILSGTKRSTWRVLDEKELSVGDHILLVNSDTGEEFGRAVIESVSLSDLSKMYDDDSDTHEKYASREEMIHIFRGFYGDAVDASTEVKVISFHLL